MAGVRVLLTYASLGTHFGREDQIAGLRAHERPFATTVSAKLGDPNRLNADLIGPCFCLHSRTRSTMVRVMAHLTASVEYGIHCLLWLVSPATPR